MRRRAVNVHVHDVHDHVKVHDNVHAITGFRNFFGMLCAIFVTVDVAVVVHVAVDGFSFGLVVALPL
ncbi:MAG TPA: hypothetical protein VGQ81_10610 [Acidobacteriota bacterium]|jgi:hypothetical protein|nr:hypothetical protein [Acidobacteriota bacterium]